MDDAVELLNAHSGDADRSFPTSLTDLEPLNDKASSTSSTSSAHHMPSPTRCLATDTEMSSEEESVV